MEHLGFSVRRKVRGDGRTRTYPRGRRGSLIARTDDCDFPLDTKILIFYFDPKRATFIRMFRALLAERVRCKLYTFFIKRVYWYLCASSLSPSFAFSLTIPRVKLKKRE